MCIFFTFSILLGRLDGFITTPFPETVYTRPSEVGPLGRLGRISWFGVVLNGFTKPPWVVSSPGRCYGNSIWYTGGCEVRCMDEA